MRKVRRTGANSDERLRRSDGKRLGASETDTVAAIRNGERKSAAGEDVQYRSQMFAIFLMRSIQLSIKKIHVRRMFQRIINLIFATSIVPRLESASISMLEQIFARYFCSFTNINLIKDITE